MVLNQTKNGSFAWWARSTKSSVARAAADHHGEVGRVGAGLPERSASRLQSQASCASEEARLLLADAERLVGDVAEVLADDLATGVVFDSGRPFGERRIVARTQRGLDGGEIVAQVAADAGTCDDNLSAPIAHGAGT